MEDSNSSFRDSYLNVIRKFLEPLGAPCLTALMIGTNDVRMSSPPLRKNITGMAGFEDNLRFILWAGWLARARGTSTWGRPSPPCPVPSS
jgi:hypothetical protein